MPFDKVPLVMIPRFGPTGGLAMCQASVLIPSRQWSGLARSPERKRPVPVATRIGRTNTCCYDLSPFSSAYSGLSCAQSLAQAALAIAPYRHMICLLWKSGISLAAENSKLKACIDKGRWVTRIRKHNDHAGRLSDPPFAKPLTYLAQGSPAWGTNYISMLCQYRLSNG